MHTTTTSGLTIETVTGLEAASALPALARLRIEIFRAFPYLYEGDEASERDYLRSYVNVPGAAIVLAKDGSRIVGAATCLPLAAETGNVQKPFIEAGMNLSRLFYFGESVLDPAYRGRGIGVAFFKAREARAAGYQTTCFCAVQRPADHPLRPKTYVPLDEFWRHRGYQRRDDLFCFMSWRDIGEAAQTQKKLIFWTKHL
ncbi:MAG TPA: GNAT family N-acetyltransferase [Acidocella sp.]|nr:GNAT family N-acetyltransferase [Acidocella sp.]